MPIPSVLAEVPKSVDAFCYVAAGACECMLPARRFGLVGGLRASQCTAAKAEVRFAHALTRSMKEAEQTKSRIVLSPALLLRDSLGSETLAEESIRSSCVVGLARHSHGLQPRRFSARRSRDRCRTDHYV